MAFSNRSGLFFFVLTLLLFSIRINARDSYSFGKFQRENPTDKNPNNLVPIQTNEKNGQDNQNPTFIPESENGYGLYGHETTYNNNEDQLKNDENVSYDDSFSTPSLSQTQESYKKYWENYPRTTESYDENNKDTSYYENSNGYGKEKRGKEAYKGYRNNVERQGMSDTRFMANGNYYFDLDDDRNHGRFYQKHQYNYNPTVYNEKDSSFKNPYSSKNMMNQQSEMFGAEQGDYQFTP
ncbi:hypothetical protein EUTSA_v10017182mg [Eutrema salsugineum]|uniref:Protein E6 n=1 Tax=Eutrema salsugineum TaxID=72664 RepID=V4LN90_EUTSA|nr:protein E6 [Eutrema salsugineum]ESQ51990.1 hypothetical protein EUTSA_v10017182mg [Eutrema salsugineum]